MVWLATQGHRIIGVELSDIAVREFFTEGGQTPARTSVGQLRNLVRGAVQHSIVAIFSICGPKCSSDVAAVYDRAALIALPPAMRTRYAETLARILPRDAIIFLVGLDYPEHEISGPPFSVSRQRNRASFLARRSTVAVLEARDGLAASPNLQKRGVTRLKETTYLLKRHFRAQA